MAANRDWKADVRDALAGFGHRNWLVVADSAFPQLVSAGVRQVLTRQDQATVVEFVAGELAAAPHLLPHVYLDAELAHIPDEHAPGIAAFRQRAAALLPSAQRVLHEELIHRLDAAGKEFSVLLLKTNSVLPYTTVFFELDCGYWDAAREKALRDYLASHKGV